ncbi:DUF47 family protein [Actinobacteria bacterium YIM 96077]|uniref:DUF47 domain-containing protein n=1 Tax=Phytoactinopolyspora halophila TaxID=1981511 RepID=A0A329QAT8_9ACTN|nr:DUF47 family protein [Phytoactinopolyspora halophila]AYY12497.1 DUF47 family protein [Actinobacteria bacterium YIM 96077]RAW09443.1 DUF47 domain-containing protein [Phytoactinopolyspora halophila]
MTISEEMTPVKTPWRRLKKSWRKRRDSGLSRALKGQIGAARDGAALARAMVMKTVTPAEARTQIAEIEHRGDEMRGELVDRLSRTLVAPLDREDLFRLSRSVDDILDTIRDFVREADLYQIEKRKTYRPFVDGVVAAVESLGEAVDALWSKPQRVPHTALEAKKAARMISREYQSEIAKIVDGAVSSQSLKHRELISRLDMVGIRINEAADVLTDGALKRGY